MGRASMFLKADGQSEAEHLKRVEFADSLMFTYAWQPGHLLRRRAGLREHRR